MGLIKRKYQLRVIWNKIKTIAGFGIESTQFLNKKQNYLKKITHMFYLVINAFQLNCIIFFQCAKYSKYFDSS